MSSSASSPPFSFLDLVDRCDNFPYSSKYNDNTKGPSSKNTAISSLPNISTDPKDTIPFLLNNIKIGILPVATVETLTKYNNALDPSPFKTVEGQGGDRYVTFAEHVNTFDTRTEVVKRLFDKWREEKVFAALSGWRDELYPIYGDSSHPHNVAFVMERSATPIFGFPTLGAHLNGYIRMAPSSNGDEGEIKMWIAKRAITKQTWPGWLDNTVAGGITYTMSVKETIVKEAMEEASLSAEIAEKARPAGAVTYFTVTENGLQPETQYVYDLELPLNVEPKPLDDEVECFYLWSIEEVIRHLRNGEFKPNCAVVIIDFLIRHSIITPENEADYLDILSRIHRQLDFPVPKYAYD